MWNHASDKWLIMQILIEFVIDTLVLELVACDTSFWTKKTLSHAHVQSVKQWDRTAHDVWEQILTRISIIQISNLWLVYICLVDLKNSVFIVLWRRDLWFYLSSEWWTVWHLKPGVSAFGVSRRLFRGLQWRINEVMLGLTFLCLPKLIFSLKIPGVQQWTADYSHGLHEAIYLTSSFISTVIV